MMETVYMNVDERRDHSFQIPRPDRSVAIQTPNACTKCHLEPKNVAEEKRSGLEYYADWLQAARDGDEQVAEELARADAWAADYTKQWYGDKADAAPRVEFAHTLHRAWNNDPGALEELLALAEDRRVSAMVRASAVSRLNNYPFEKTRAVAAKALKDRDPLVRAAGISVFHGNNVAPFVRELGPLLEDPTRFVRIQAALALAGLPLNTISRERRDAMDRSLEEHLVALKVNSDLTGSHMARALLAESFQDWRSAEQAYRDAIRVMPGVTGPRSNLVAILEREQRMEEAQDLRTQELALMKRDAGLAPDNAWLQYRLGLAMYRENKLAEAETSLRRAMELEPNVADFTLAVTLLYKKQERWSDAVSLCERLLELDANRGNQQLYGELRMALQKSQHVGPAAP